ncbi:MAG: tetratricopeptide repeat protein, partial [Methanothrix sp.]
MQPWSYAMLMIMIFLALYALWLLNLVVTIQDTSLFLGSMGNVANSLGTIRDILLSLLEIILIVVVIYSLYLLWRWVQKDDNDVFIHPFIVGTCDGKYDGAAISDLLIAELLRIQSIHRAGKRPEESRQIEESRETFVSQTVESKKTPGLFGMAPSDASITLPPFAPSSMNFAYNISNSITVSGGPITFSVDQILVLAKKISGHSGRIITGSIQEYGSTIALIAWMGTPKKAAWKVKRNAEEANILDMVDDLAFMIAMDVTKETIAAKTWLGLKFYTLALEEYHRYKLCGPIERLSRSRELCLDAVKAERDYKEPSKLLFNIGMEYIRVKSYPEAEKSFDDAISLRPRANIFLGLGIALSEQKKYDEAIKAYDKAIELKPDFAGAWNNKGNALGELGKHDEAIKAFDRAIELKPDFGEAWYDKGLFLSEQDKHDEAIKAYDKAIELKPNSVRARFNKGVALSNLRKHDEAIKAYDKAIGLKPNFIKAWNNKGVALSKLGKHDEAIKAYDKAIELKPDFAGAWIFKGLVLSNLGKHDEAIKAYDKAIELKPDDAVAWCNKGIA